MTRPAKKNASDIKSAAGEKKIGEIKRNKPGPRAPTLRKTRGGYLPKKVEVIRGKGGQPYFKYHLDLCDKIREWGREGLMPEEWAAKIGISMATLKTWRGAEEAFELAYGDAITAAQAWWVDFGRMNMTNPALRTSLYNRHMAARFREDYSSTRWMPADEMPEMVAASGSGDDVTEPVDQGRRAPHTMTPDEIDAEMAQLKLVIGGKAG